MPAAHAAPSRAGAAFALAGASVACAAWLAVQDTGSSRMLVWPWQLLYWLGPLAAGGSLALGLSVADAPRLSRRWFLAMLAAAAGLTGSTAASPFLAQILPWCVWPLTLVALAAVGGRLFACPRHGGRRSELALLALGVAGVALTLTSLTMWLASLAPDFARAAASRNPHPLGHANYTAGSALLFLPVLAGLAWLGRGWRRAAWAAAALLCASMLFSAGSRGGLLGLAASLAPALLIAWRRLPRWSVFVCAALALGVGLLQPGVRRGLLPPPPDAPVNMSNAQRATWIEAAGMAISERPLLGWGTGATPWFMPRYRSDLDYGPYEVLQLHNTPFQLWAEGGCATVLAALALGALVLGEAVRIVKAGGPARADTPAWIAVTALAGHGVFALTDWQLDLPVVCATTGVLLGIVASRSTGPVRPSWCLTSRTRAGLAVTVALLAVTAFVGVGQLRLRAALERDDWRAALELAPHDAALRIYAADRWLHTADGGPADADARRERALSLLAANAQAGLIPELTHSLAGWARLRAGAPEAALADFDSAVRVAPNHHGALVGGALAAVALGQRQEALARLTRASIARPRFLVSGWWRHPGLAPLREDVSTRVNVALGRLTRDATARPSVRREAEYLLALNAWIDGEDAAAATLVTNARTTDLSSFWTGLTGSSSPARIDALPAGLRAVLRLEADPADDFWMLVIRERLGGGVALEREDALATGRPVVELMREALAPRVDSPWPYYERRATRAGFQVNHRHPRLHGVSDGGVHSENLWADLLLASLWPEEFWLPDSLLLGMAGVNRPNRPGTNP